MFSYEIVSRAQLMGRFSTIMIRGRYSHGLGLLLNSTYLSNLSLGDRNKAKVRFSEAINSLEEQTSNCVTEEASQSMPYRFDAHHSIQYGATGVCCVRCAL